MNPDPHPPSPERAAFPSEHLPGNHAPLDPYFGTFLSLLRVSLDSGGSEFGLGLSLFSLAVSIRARTIVEIGRFQGFSALALASALRLLDAGWQEPLQHKQRPDVDYSQWEAPGGRKLYSIEAWPAPEAAALLERAGLLAYVELVNLPSQAINLEGAADLIFIDGDHSYDGCSADVRKYVPHLRAGGYFVLHDYFGWYGRRGVNDSPVKRVIDELIAAGGLEHLLIDTGYMSFVIFRKPHPDD